MIHAALALVLQASSATFPAQATPPSVTTAPSVLTTRLRIVGSLAKETDRPRLLETCVSVLEQRLAQAKIETSSVRIVDDQIVIETNAVKAKDLDDSLPFLLRRAVLEFRVIATKESDGIDIDAETARLQERLAQSSTAPSEEEIRALEVNLADGRTAKWVKIAPTERDRFESPVPFVLVIVDPKHSFGCDDLRRTFMDQDMSGRPALGFELRADRSKAFGDFTEANLNRRLAIVLDGEVLTAPSLLGRIENRGIIEGGATGFEERELKLLIASFRAGALPVALERVIETK